MRLFPASALVAPVTILLLFASALVGIDRLGFRDVGHFYTPLYDYVASRTSSQWLPLWNPLDETGIPLVGETTTAVIYPVRYLLFALPIATGTAIAWYVALHLMLASVTAWWAARWSSAGPVSASIAGVIYPLSGSLLFLYTNPPYLVGAAWLPLVIGVMITRNQMSAAARIGVGGVSMAMMILGGDPQTALHAMILVALVWLVRLVGSLRMPGRSEDRLPLKVLIAVPCLAALLALPQIAASVSWSRLSERTEADEIGSWFDPPLIGGRRYEAFQYSLAPWHTLELATPNAFGSLLPINRRISRLVPGDGRMWTPSIYMGMLTVVALLSMVGRPTASGSKAWLAIAMVSLLMAMGHFGLVWWIQTTTGTMMQVDSAIGGPYWMLYQLLPGYDAFRYPAKWLTFFSLACSMLTAIAVERGLEKRTVQRVAVILATGLVVAFAVTLLGRWNPTILFDPSGGLVQDEFWGPLDVNGGLSEISGSLVHSAMALVAILLVVRWKDGRNWSANRTGFCLLAITCAELAVCASALVARVPTEMEDQLLARTSNHHATDGLRWMRTQSGDGWPAEWKETRDIDRLADVETSGRQAWFGRWHLADRAPVLNNMVSIRSRAVARFWRTTRLINAELTPPQREPFWMAIREWLHISGVLHATSRTIDLKADGRTAKLVDAQQIVLGPYEPLRIHPKWTFAGQGEPTTQQFAQRLREIAASAGSPIPVVQATSGVMPAPDDVDGRSTLRQLSQDGDSELFDLHLTGIALVTRPVFQDGHWTCQYSPANSNHWQPVAVDRVDHLMQGVILPAGDWKLRFRYSPWWLGPSVVIAIIAWLAIAATLLQCWKMRTGSLADTESSEDAVEDVVGVDSAGHLTE